MVVIRNVSVSFSSVIHYRRMGLINSYVSTFIYILGMCVIS